MLLASGAPLAPPAAAQSGEDAPSTLAIASVDPVSPGRGQSFSVTVESRTAAGAAAPVGSATEVSLSRGAGSGALTGPLSRSIPAGASSVTFTDVYYDTAEAPVTVVASRTAGDPLTAGESGPFAVTATTVTQVAVAGILPAVRVAGEAFSLTAQTQDASGIPTHVETSTAVELSVDSGAGRLDGVTSLALPPREHTLEFPGLTYDTAEYDVVLRAEADGLLSGTSAPFDVYAPGPLTLTATKPADTDDGSCNTDCSLREALFVANRHAGDDEVVVPAGTYVLELGQLVVASNVTVRGDGTDTTIIDAADRSRVITAPGGRAVLSDLTIRNGRTPHNGAGIHNGGGSLELVRTAVRDNTSTEDFYGGGGGIYNSGTLVIRDSAVTGNTSLLNGGGLMNDFATATILDSLVSGNTADSRGGGVANEGGTMTVQRSALTDNHADGYFSLGGAISSRSGNTRVIDSTVSGNTASREGGGLYIETSSTRQSTITNASIIANGAPIGGNLYQFGSAPHRYLLVGNSIIAWPRQSGNCLLYGHVTSLGYNLSTDGSCGFMTGEGDRVGVNPGTGPLSDNGGPTPTHALTESSAAFNHVPAEHCPSDADQRGIRRPQGGACDSGAFEVDVEEGVITVAPTTSTVAPGYGGSFTISLDPAPEADVVIPLRPPAGVTITGGDTVTIAAGATAATVEFTVADEIAQGPHEIGLEPSRSEDRFYALVPPSPSEFTVVVPDTIAPESTITAAPAAATTASRATFAFEGTDNVTAPADLRFECREDGGAWAPCDSPHEVTGLSEGAHTFDVRAADETGNTDPTPARHDWARDLTAPDTAITAAPSDPSGASEPTFAFAGTDERAAAEDLTYECEVDGGGFSPCTSPHRVVPGLGDGRHAFAVRATDDAGNTDPSPARHEWTVDTVVPETELTAGPDGPAASRDAAFSFTGRDDRSAAGDLTFECRLDGGAFAPCASPHGIVALDDGDHTFAVRAADEAGNRDPTPAATTWTVDTKPPQTSITDAPSPTTRSQDATFGFRGSDERSAAEDLTFECRLDEGGFGPCTSPHHRSGLAEGPHTFAVRATDELGHTDPTPATRSWVVDRTPPETVITHPPPDPSNFPFALVPYDGSDNHSERSRLRFECSVDGRPFGRCPEFPHNPPESLADGRHTFRVRATDEAGNTDPTPATYTWTVDTADPVTRIATRPADPSAEADAAFTFTGTDNHSAAEDLTYECRLDGAAFAPCGRNQEFSGLGDGRHTLQVRATDEAGNTDETPVGYSWTIDTVAPATAITGGPPDPSRTAGATFAFTGTDDHSAAEDLTYECRLDGAAFARCTGPHDVLDLDDGDHTFAVRAVDAAGNTDPTPATYSWRVDTTPPAISVPPDQEVRSSVPTTVDYPPATATDADPATPDVVCAPAASSDVFPLGETTVTCTSTDAAGNTAQATFLVTVVTLDAAVDGAVADIEAMLDDDDLPPAAADDLAKARDDLEEAALELDAGEVRTGLGAIAHAVKHLRKAADEGAAVDALIDSLVESSRRQAQDAIDAAVAAGGDQDEIDRSREAMGEAEEKLADDRPDMAVKTFRKAWAHARKAVGE